MKPVDRFTHRKLSELEIATSAIRFRDQIGISDKLYVDIIDVLEFSIPMLIPDFKLMVRRDIELEHTAETKENPPRIFVKETIYDAACEGDQEARRILAHELGHLLLHYEIEGSKQKSLVTYQSQFDTMNALDSTESQADIYARNFLVPPYFAFAHRHNLEELSRLTGAPIQTVAAAVTISKRTEMLKVRHFPDKVKLKV